MDKPQKFNYVEPTVGVSGRLHCNECKHILTEHCGHLIRKYGIIKTLHITDPDFGKLVLYCDKQQAYVKPYSWCDEVVEGKCQKL